METHSGSFPMLVNNDLNCLHIEEGMWLALLFLNLANSINKSTTIFVPLVDVWHVENELIDLDFGLVFRCLISQKELFWEFFIICITLSVYDAEFEIGKQFRVLDKVVLNAF
jgi:hypothetical protein